MSVNAIETTKTGIITLFGVASDADLIKPSSFVARNQYYQANSGGDDGIISHITTETKGKP